MHKTIAVMFGGSNAALLISVVLLAGGCATTPQYSVRQAPQPVETSAVIQFEREISAEQAKEFEQHDARRIRSNESLWGFSNIPGIVERLSRVTERPSLGYSVYLYQDEDPNAAALADGRVYISSGMLDYLAQRNSRPDELAFIIGHELAHTVAQHLVKRYDKMRQQQVLVGLVSAGAAIATRGASQGAQQAASMAVSGASLLRDVSLSGYSQEQELEADQLGIRYMISAGYNPQAALEMLNDFARFDSGSPFLRTHPYIQLRREYLQRYLTETGSYPSANGTSAPASLKPPSLSQAPRAVSGRDIDARRAELRKIQQLYPKGSVSWNNLQKQIDSLK